MPYKAIALNSNRCVIILFYPADLRFTVTNRGCELSLLQQAMTSLAERGGHPIQRVANCRRHIACTAWCDNTGAVLHPFGAPYGRRTSPHLPCIGLPCHASLQKSRFADGAAL
jgi:hypothetical protein